MRVMLDSGGYSAMTHKQSIDIDEYIAYLKFVISRYPTQVAQTDFEYFTLDVIGDGEKTYKNWEYMRKVGLRPIPIYHTPLSEKLLERYLTQTNRIAVGSISAASERSRTTVLDRLWSKYFCDQDGTPVCRVHGLGITSFAIMRRYPWYSLDSSSWLLLAAYGKIWVKVAGSDYPKIVHISTPTGKWRQAKQILSRAEFEYVERYIADLGFVMDGDEGARNSYTTRAKINASFLNSFVTSLPWPRRFEVGVARTLNG